MKSLYELIHDSQIKTAKEVQSELEQPLWNLEAIQVYKAREEFKVAGEGVNIAVIDTGVDKKHTEIEHAIKGGINILDPYRPAVFKDKAKHGTQIIGVIAGKRTGVAPRANIYVVKQSGIQATTDAKLLFALSWCYDNFEKIDIINISSGFVGHSKEIESACSELYEKGKIIVAAAGNYGTGALFPASYDKSVISVAAVDKDLGHCIFSNIWPTVDVAAPGEGILSSYSRKWNKDYYAIRKGTSLAAPHVTGIIALALSLLRKHNKTASTNELEKILKETCLKLWESDTTKADELVNTYQQYYDQRKLFLRDKEITLESAYGGGLIQAYDFLSKLCKIRGIK